MVAWLADLSVSQILVGIAITEWVVYAFTVRSFVRRQALDRPRVVRFHVVHLSAGLLTYFATAGCAALLDGAPIAIAAIAELALGLAALCAVLLGGRWIPAGAVLARRLGAGPERGVFRAGWSVVGWGG